MSIEAMRQALAALELTSRDYREQRHAVSVLRQAIEQAEKQEPVAWVNQANLNSAAIQRNRGGQGDMHTWSETPTWDYSVPLYTSPPPRQPLTDDEISALRREVAALSANALDDYKMIQSLMAERQPLTDQKIYFIWRKHIDPDAVRYTPYEDDGLGFARAIEAAHGIKGDA
jgi:hypothetical protein